MPFISITRLRVRSWRYMPSFVWHTYLSVRQAKHAPGFLLGKMVRDAKNTFWTETVWDTEAAMRAYRNGGAHARVMPKLLEWCDEASVAHWNQENNELPSLQEAHRRMVEIGRSSKVKHPSPAHAAKQITAPSESARAGLAFHGTSKPSESA